MPSPIIAQTFRSGRPTRPVAAARFGANLNNSTFTIVAGVAGQVIECHTLVLTVAAAAGADLLFEDSGGGLLARVLPNLAGYLVIDLKGQRAGLGLGVRVNDPNAVAVSIFGSLSYRQFIAL